ncbi:hypothetical protein KC480_05445 [Bacillus velezensis]|uniref:hypothetical protein n=1 Tax=Bacillus velezensis TaxID=492670 RepID=UPI001E41D150|nr:hypothetical protein [Bacillus velezensis]MCD7910969.1 hypothetical protein [Bacillus velezensis]
MKKLKVGLAANKTSYFDPLTNTYITLNKPVVTVQYDDYKVLKNITHALLSSIPALVLYEGKLPEKAIEEWKEKYMKPFRTDMSKLRRALTGDMVPPAARANRAFDRAERIEKESIDFPEDTPVKVEEPKEEETPVEEPKQEETPEEEKKKEDNTVASQSLNSAETEEIELFSEEEPKTKGKKGAKNKKSEK